MTGFAPLKDPCPGQVSVGASMKSLDLGLQPGNFMKDRCSGEGNGKSWQVMVPKTWKAHDFGAILETFLGKKCMDLRWVQP